MNQYLIMIDFDNSFGDLTVIRAKDFTEAISIFKKERKKDSWIIKELNRDEYDYWEELMDWVVDEQTPEYHKYHNKGVSIIIYKIPTGSYNLIARYGDLKGYNLFDFLHKRHTI